MTVGDLLNMLEDAVEFDPVFGSYDMMCRYKGKTMYVTDIVVRTFKNSFVCLNCDLECDDERNRITINNAIVKLKNYLSKKSINNETEIIGYYNLEMMRNRLYDISFVDGHLRIRFTTNICIPRLIDAEPKHWLRILYRKNVKPEMLRGSGIRKCYLKMYEDYYQYYDSKKTWLICVMKKDTISTITSRKIYATEEYCRLCMQELVSQYENAEHGKKEKINKTVDADGEITLEVNAIAIKYLYIARNRIE